MTKQVAVKDGMIGTPLTLEPKGFLRGSLRGDEPSVSIVVRSQGDVVGHFELRPDDAQILSDYLRQEAEFAAAAQEETTA